MACDLPTGLVLLSVVYYYNGPRPLFLYLGAYALLSLLYVVRTNYNEQERHWRKASVRYEKGSWLTFIRAGLLASLVVLLLSWSLPAMSASSSVSDALSGTQGPWREFQDNWTRLFSSLRTYGAATADPYQETLTLGGPRTVGSTLIMDVTVPRQLRSVYWQAIAYDTYENGGWLIAEDTQTRLHFPDDGLLPVPLSSSREVVKQVVHNYVPNSSFLYAAPELMGSDKQMFVESTRDAQDRELVTSARSRFVLRQGETYEVTSRLSIADAQSLRASGNAYPEWVTERYLQVPETVTPETRALAAQLTAPYDNPFDKTLAVRDYLRDAITYNDQIEAPPEGVEPIHHILFETQEGYCNYYASAMAMMLRSEGVPSRVVSGFAQGEFDEESSSYRVRASNAHTWVEAYFPQYGWIQFEPTVSLPTVDRPESSGGGDAFASPVFPGPLGLEDEIDPRLSEEDPGLALDAEEGLENRAGGGSFPIWQALIAAVVLLIAAAVVFVAYESNKRVEGDIDGSYRRLGFWAGLLGILYGPAETPYERAERMTVVVPEGRSSIRNLTQQYVQKQFSGNYVEDDSFDARQEWRELRPLVIRESIAIRFRRWQAKRSKPGGS